MLAPHSLILVSTSPEDTCQIACRVATHLAAGDTILLSGDVGAGKTHFARCLIQSLLSEPEDVPSPTYTLVQTYCVAPCEIWHADLYRLTDTSEIEELGLLQAFEEAITLIEWPDRLGDLQPVHALNIGLESGDDEDTRILTLTWSNPRWATKLEAIRNA